MIHCRRRENRTPGRDEDRSFEPSRYDLEILQHK